MSVYFRVLIVYWRKENLGLLRKWKISWNFIVNGRMKYDMNVFFVDRWQTKIFSKMEDINFIWNERKYQFSLATTCSEFIGMPIFLTAANALHAHHSDQFMQNVPRQHKVVTAIIKKSVFKLEKTTTSNHINWKISPTPTEQ